MSITDRTRRRLWGQSAARCALCRRHLVEQGTEISEASVVGEEAHIVARSPGGPRYEPLAKDDAVDHIDNLILLCRVHHKQVDDQVADFPVEVLHTLKAQHESLMRRRTADDVDSAPEDSKPTVLPAVHTGSQLWDIVADAMAYRTSGLEDNQAPQEVCDAIDSFLQQAVDWGDIAGDVKSQGLHAVRDAKRSLHDALVEIHELDLRVFGIARLEASGYAAIGEWLVATVAVIKATDVGIVAVSP
jgi:hypothetical protein